MISLGPWIFWIRKKHNSCNFFQHCRMPTTPQQVNHMQQRLSHQSWNQLHHLGPRRTLHQSRRSKLISRTRHSSPPLDMQRWLFYFSPLEGRITVVFPHGCYSDNMCQLLSMSITVKMVTCRNPNFTFLLYVSRKVKL